MAGVFSISARARPVHRGDGVVATLGIVVPSLRRDKARLVSALKVAAHGIGRSLSPAPKDRA